MSCRRRAERAQLGRLRVWQRAQRRAHSLCKVGHGTGIEDIGFGQLPGRFRKVPYLARIHHHEGKAAAARAATTARW